MSLVPGLGRSPGEENDNPVFLPGKSHGQRSLAGYRRNIQDPSLLFENVNPNWKNPQEIEGLWTSEKMFTKQVEQMICWLSSFQRIRHIHFKESDAS